MNKFTAFLIFSFLTIMAEAQPSGMELNFQRVRSGDRFVSDGNHYRARRFITINTLQDLFILMMNWLLQICTSNTMPTVISFWQLPTLIHQTNRPKFVAKAKGMKIMVNNEEFITLPSVNNRFEMQNYQVVVRGKKVTLLKKISKLFIEGSRATTSLTRDVPSTYSDRSDFYMLSPTGDFTEVPSSSRKILALFPEDRKALATAVKKYRLNLKKEIDLIRFIGYYNRL